MQECAQTSEIMSRIGSLFCGLIKGNCAPYWSELMLSDSVLSRRLFSINMNVCQHALKSDDLSRRSREKETSITSQTDGLSLCYHVSENSDWCLREPYGDEIEFFTLRGGVIHGEVMWVNESWMGQTSCIAVVHVNECFSDGFKFPLREWNVLGDCLKVLEVSVGSVQTRGKWTHSIVVKQSCFPNHWKCLQMCRQILHLRSHLSTEDS